MSVDLPEPDGPMMATDSPSMMSSETPSSACTVSPPTTYSLRRSRKEMSASAVMGADTSGTGLDRRAGAGLLLDLDAVERPQVAQHLVRPGDDLVARLELLGRGHAGD